MSRASEITLFLIILQASIGFITSIGLFSLNYMNVPSNNASYTLTDLETYNSVQNPSVTDELIMVAHWAFEGFVIGIKIIFTVLFIFPTLVSTFKVPLALSLFIQAGVYYVYATWYAQYKSGKGWKLYE